MRCATRCSGHVVLAAFAALGLPQRALPANPDYSVSFVQVSEGWRIASGGAATGNAYLDHQHIEFEISDALASGSQALGAHVEAAGGNGHCASCLAGDTQGISNIEGMDGWRLYQIWADWLPAEHYSLRTGLYDLNSEFDSVATASLFLNASHGMGPALGFSGRNGPSVFPITSMGLRLQSAAPRRWWQIAVFDGMPGSASNPDRPSLHMSSREGALIIAEAGRGSDATGRLALGIWEYTARFEALAAESSAEQTTRGNRGAYMFAESRHDEHDGPQLDGYARIGVAASRFNGIDLGWSAGAVMRHFIPGRPDDQLGLALAVAHQGAPARRSAAADGAPIPAAEYNFELTLRTTPRSWLALQPSVQYILHPGAASACGNALALGLRVELSASWER